jgi:hypothetical protein
LNDQVIIDLDDDDDEDGEPVEAEDRAAETAPAVPSNYQHASLREPTVSPTPIRFKQPYEERILSGMNDDEVTNPSESGMPTHSRQISAVSSQQGQDPWIDSRRTPFPSDTTSEHRRRRSSAPSPVNRSARVAANLPADISNETIRRDSLDSLPEQLARLQQTVETLFGPLEMLRATMQSCLAFGVEGRNFDFAPCPTSNQQVATTAGGSCLPPGLMQAVQALVSAKDALDAQTIVVKATLAHQDKEERLEKELAGLRWSYNQTLQDMVVLKAAQQKAESACEGLLTQIDMKDGQIDLHRRLEEEYNAAIEGLERRMGDTHREMQKQRERAERADGEVARLTTQLGALKTEVRRGN